MLAVNADYGWDVWNEWSECSATCGGGVSERTRECLIAGGMCNGAASETKECNTQPCGREYMHGQSSAAILQQKYRSCDNGTLHYNFSYPKTSSQ